MEIEATLIHRLSDYADGIYAWRAMLLDTETMEARSDQSVEDYWHMDELENHLAKYGGWLELKVADPDGMWAMGAVRPDSTDADAWIIPAALVNDAETISAYNDQYGEGRYALVVSLDD